MGLSIYLDDSLDNDLLIALLEQAGHKVVSPRFVGTTGWDDNAHLEFAAQHEYVLLTADVVDFEELHLEWQSQGKRHAGIFLVYYEGNVRKDMTPYEIVRAIDKLVTSEVPIFNEIHRLNQWR